MTRETLLRPVDDVSEPSFLRRLFDTIELLFNGRTRNQGSFTLTANATTTTVEHPLFESHQTPKWTALTANAAAALTSMYVSARDQGSFTITHNNTADTDRDFEFTFVG